MSTGTLFLTRQALRCLVEAGSVGFLSVGYHLPFVKQYLGMNQSALSAIDMCQQDPLTCGYDNIEVLHIYSILYIIYPYLFSLWSLQ